MTASQRGTIVTLLGFRQKCGHRPRGGNFQTPHFDFYNPAIHEGAPSTESCSCRIDARDYGLRKAIATPRDKNELII